MNPVRPNILFIMSDDHAPQALSCYGSQINQTPNLDRLAREGVRFTHCYDTVALCAPARASLITGKYCHKHGFYRNKDQFDGSQQTFPKLLQAAGYETAIFGKWHLGTEPEGFDYYSLLPGHGWYWNPELKESDLPWESPGRHYEGYLTELLAEKPIEWLSQRRQDKPFCAMIHHKAPHTQHEYPKRYEELYREDLPFPETFDDDYDSRGVLRDAEAQWSKLTRIVPGDLKGNELGDQPEADRSDPESFKRWAYQTFFKGYLRLIASMDDSIGRVLDYLDASGMADNTLVVYTSDNGFFLGDHGLYNKMWMYEESLGLPLLMRWPGIIKPASVQNELASLLDFAPTFLDLAGAPIPEDLQGASLLPILREQQAPVDWRDCHYYHYYGQFGVPSHCGIRTDTHKLIWFYEAETPENQWELFDLQSDPREVVNLASDPGSAACLESMREKLRKQLVDLQVTEPGV